MTIKEFIDKEKSEKFNGIPFLLTDVNYGRELDVEEKTSYEDDKEYSFLERLQMAKEEIENDMKNNNITDIESAFSYYKERTEEGNSNYWGGMMSVWTVAYNPSYLLYDVRMD